MTNLWLYQTPLVMATAMKALNEQQTADTCQPKLFCALRMKLPVSYPADLSFSPVEKWIWPPLEPSSKLKSQSTIFIYRFSYLVQQTFSSLRRALEFILKTLEWQPYLGYKTLIAWTNFYLFISLKIDFHLDRMYRQGSV